MKVKKYNRPLKLIILTLLFIICLALPCLAYAASPDITGVMSQVNDDLEQTLNPVPKYALPIYYLLIGLLGFFKIGGLIKEYLAHKNDATQSKEITDKIIKVVAIIIGFAIIGPLLITGINAILGTHFNV